MSVQQAKSRAEEWLSQLQKRARELLDAEEGFLNTLRQLLEDGGMQASDVRAHLEKWLGRLAARRIWERVTHSDTVVALHDYRGTLERKVDQNLRGVLNGLKIASTEDVEELERQIQALHQKLTQLATQRAPKQGAKGAAKTPAKRPAKKK